MRNIDCHSNFRQTATKQQSKMRPRHLILGLSLIAALFSVGCPQQSDPLQAFNNQSQTTTTTGTTTTTTGTTDQGPAPVPEPATALLFGVALLVGGGIVRRRRSHSHQ